jgi:cell division protease FtsH
MRLPEHDRFSVTRAKLKDDLIVAFGGRAAEELIFGYEQVTTGASSDIQQATSMARAMVTKWGLSDKVGAIDYGEDDGSRFYAANKPYSQETGRIIDEEVKRIISEGLAEAKKILNEKKDDLEKLARALLEYETLSGEEIKDLLAGKEIRKPSVQSGSAASAISEGLIPKVS